MLRRFARMMGTMALAAVLAAPVLAGETMTLKIGYPPGGGFDLSGRLFARHFGRFIEGNPTVVVQNVPGGGSLKLTEMMLESEPGDGTVVGMISPTMATAPLLDPGLQHLRASEIRWIGGLRNEASVCFTGKNSGIETVDDFRTKDILIGASGKASTTYMHAALVKTLLGANFTIVTGFQGISDIDAAIQRGEIAGRCSASYSSLPALGLTDIVNVIVSVVSDDATKAAGIPELSDFAASQLDRDAADIVTGTLRFHQPVMLPFSAAPEIVDDYRAAFDRMVADPEFLADAERTKAEIAPTSGRRIDEIVATFYAQPPETVARARDMIR
ncbi:hypothetical protein [Aquibium microcysteis]|uniref:hypothetical protein n=1 Tax=Aquibium microcysteis TaxID=675281 RepID=UPI00165CFB48|nr:hypothetical protein [Aquibium microcysteis]